MILIYRILTFILYPFLFLFLYARIITKKEDPIRFKEKILSNHFRVHKNKNSRLIWFHAASIGEFKSIVPIIKKINEKKENLEFLITTSTLSSSNLANDVIKNLNNVQHRFVPYDIDHLVKNFLKLWQPNRIFLVDSEIWPNLILKARDQGIPIALINARLTKKSFKRWSMFPKTAEKIFSKFNLCLCANEETKKFLNILKAKNVKYEGNVKLINDIDADKLRTSNLKELKKSKVWMAASIHEEEDIICLKTHLELKKKFKNIVTIIAPRHLNRVNNIKNLSENLKLKTQILNRNDNKLPDSEVLIINSFGLLKNYFLYAKSVFLGKSLIERLKNDSGQSPMDAVYLNCKIYHGPYVSNFKEIYEILKVNGISKMILNPNELIHNLLIDFKNLENKDPNISSPIKKLGNDVLTKNMKEINSFLNDKNQ